MTAPKSVDPAGFLRERLESASPDLLPDGCAHRWGNREAA